MLHISLRFFLLVGRLRPVQAAAKANHAASRDGAPNQASVRGLTVPWGARTVHAHALFHVRAAAVSQSGFVEHIVGKGFNSDQHKSSKSERR